LLFSNSNYGAQIGIGIEIDQKAAFMAKIGSFDTDPDSDPDLDSIKMRIDGGRSTGLTKITLSI